MSRKIYVLIAFILVALVQLFVPFKMIFNREAILNSGVEYKFKTAPVDPNDPFRGKYINLNYEEITFETSENLEWERGESVYVSLTTDNKGFAKINSISKNKPTAKQVFVTAKVNHFFGNDSSIITIDYPFNRYYLEETLAHDAELVAWNAQSDTTKNTYALVCIKDGETVLKDVLIDGISIRKIVKEQSNKE